MKIAIIGRSELLYNTASHLIELGYEIPLIITAKEAPEYKITSEDYREFAEKIGAKFIKTARINRKEIIEQIKFLGTIDIAVSINFSGIIAEEVINLFPLGILNAHGGDLPRYRGNACQAWAILNKEEKIGLCIHQMIGGELDSGDILSRKYLPINIDTRIGEVYDWMYQTIPLLMVDAIEELSINSIFFLEKQSKDPKDTLRTYPRNPSDGKIDWKSSNEDIIRLINASSEPFSGAFCNYEGEKLIIWRAFIYEDTEIYYAAQGQVASINKTDKYIVVITGLGKIKITEIEYKGERTVPTDVIKSIRKRLR